MARRSPWAKQERKQVRKIRKEHLNVPVKKGHRDPMEFISRENTTNKQKIDFLLNHTNETVSVFREEGRRLGLPFIKNMSSQDLRHATESLISDRALASYFVSEVGLKLLERSSKAQEKVFTKQYKRFLEQRKLPFERKVFDVTLREFLSEQEPRNWVSGRFSVADFERLYISNFKEFRMFQITKNTHNNIVISEAFKGIRLTGNQKRTARRWLDRNFSKYKDLLQLKLKKMGELKVRNGVEGYLVSEKDMQKISAEVFSKMAADLREQFSEFAKKPIAKKKTSQITKTSSSAKKPGTRDERIASYNKRTKEEMESSKRKKEITVAQATSGLSGKKFDATSHCLSVLKKDDPKIERQFSTLLKNKELSPGIFVKIFTSGNLTQRRFLQVANSKTFREQFGIKGVNAAGNFLSAIGPKVIKIEAVVNSVRSKDASAIFKFLEKKGILDTNHRNGKFVMLMR